MPEGWEEKRYQFIQLGYAHDVIRIESLLSICDEKNDAQSLYNALEAIHLLIEKVANKAYVKKSRKNLQEAKQLLDLYDSREGDYYHES